MNINIYQKYKVIITITGSELSEENETIYDNIFTNYHSKASITMDGGELLNKIADHLKDNYLSEFRVVLNELRFDYFNYNNGENEHICYKILEDIESKGEDNGQDKL